MVRNGIFEPSTLSWPSVLYPYRQACFHMFWPTKICEFQDAEVQCMIWKGLVNGRSTNRIRPHLPHLISTPYGIGTRFNLYLASENLDFLKKMWNTWEFEPEVQSQKKAHKNSTVKAWEPHFRPQTIHPESLRDLVEAGHYMAQQRINVKLSFKELDPRSGSADISSFGWNLGNTCAFFNYLKMESVASTLLHFWFFNLKIPVSNTVKGLGSDCLLNLCCFNFR